MDGLADHLLPEPAFLTDVEGVLQFFKVSHR
jgi:hypothetical protein